MTNDCPEYDVSASLRPTEDIQRVQKKSEVHGRKISSSRSGEKQLNPKDRNVSRRLLLWTTINGLNLSTTNGQKHAQSKVSEHYLAWYQMAHSNQTTQHHLSSMLALRIIAITLKVMNSDAKQWHASIVSLVLDHQHQNTTFKMALKNPVLNNNNMRQTLAMLMAARVAVMT